MAKGIDRGLQFGTVAWPLMGVVAAIAGGCSAGAGVVTRPDGGDAGHHVEAGSDAHSGTHTDAKATADGRSTGDAPRVDEDAKGTRDSGDGATACTNHLPEGFTQVVASAGVVNILTGAAGARAQAMTHDEADDPLFAYATEDSATSWSIHFTRWDACAGRFTAPVTIDTLRAGAQPDVSIAYDPSTKEVGIAYVRSASVNNWLDAFGEVWLATRKASATAFTIQQLTTGSTDDNGASSPSIAMSGGNIYIALADGPYRLSYPGLVLFLQSTTTPEVPTTNLPPAIPDGGPLDGTTIPSSDDAGADAGPPPPHYFTAEAMPFPGGYEGYANPLGTSASISVAVDSSGAPAVAAYQVGTSYGKLVLFWRPGTKSATAVATFSTDNAVDLSLGFLGTMPRIAGHMVLPQTDASTTGLDTLTFVASEDGNHWGPPVNLPTSGTQATAFTSALAVDVMGRAAAVADINAGGGGMGCGGNPYVALSTDKDAGVLFKACGADQGDVHGYSSYSVSAFYGSSRLRGTLAVSFVSKQSTVTDAGADQAGIVYWQGP